MSGLELMNEVVCWEPFIADLVDKRHEWEETGCVLHLEEGEDFLGSRRALQHLATQQFLFQVIHGFASSNQCLSNFPIAAANAAGDQVGNPAALKEGLILNRVTGEKFTKSSHLIQAHPDDSCLGVIAHLEAIHNPSSHCDNILQSSTKLHAQQVVDHSDTEVISFDHVFEEFPIGLVNAADGGFAEEFLGDFVGQVGAHHDGHVNGEGFSDHLGGQHDAAALGVEAFDQRDTSGIRTNALGLL